MDSKGIYDDGGLNQTDNQSQMTPLTGRNNDQPLEKDPFITNDAPAVIDTSHIKRDGLEKRHMAAYAVGHLSNDLCAAGWFFYLVFYLKFIVNLSPGQAGLAMLSG